MPAKKVAGFVPSARDSWRIAAALSKVLTEHLKSSQKI